MLLRFIPIQIISITLALDAFRRFIPAINTLFSNDSIYLSYLWQDYPTSRYLHVRWFTASAASPYINNEQEEFCLRRSCNYLLDQEQA